MTMILVLLSLKTYKAACGVWYTQINFELDFREHGEGTFYIYIYDEFSNIMYQGSTNSVEKTVFTQDIPPGTYFLHIHTADEITYQQLHISR